MNMIEDKSDSLKEIQKNRVKQVETLGEGTYKSLQKYRGKDQTDERSEQNHLQSKNWK